jgi:hypothetical protein
MGNIIPHVLICDRKSIENFAMEKCAAWRGV